MGDSLIVLLPLQDLKLFLSFLPIDQYDLQDQPTEIRHTDWMENGVLRQVEKIAFPV